MTCSTTAESVSQNAESRRWRYGSELPTGSVIDSLECRKKNPQNHGLVCCYWRKVSPLK